MRSSKKATKSKAKKRRFIPYHLLFLIEIIIIIALVVLGTLFIVINRIETTPMDESKVVTVEQDPNMDHYTNIALFGIDTRSQDINSEKSRSDAIIIASIHNSTKEVKLISVYRDLLCSVNGTYTKATHAYAYGGPELAVSTLNRNLDLNITKYATVNFKIMAEIVDAIGGIQLEVEPDFIDDLNKFIKEVNRLNGGNSSTFDSAGIYTFDGNQTVAYSRIRHNQNGDISRANRQRIVLQAIMKQGQSHPIAFAKAMNEVLPKIQTNLSSDDLFKMSLSAFRYDIKSTQGFPYQHKELRLSDGLYYDVPATLTNNVVTLHEDLFGTSNYQVSDELSKINTKICWKSGVY